MKWIGHKSGGKKKESDEIIWGKKKIKNHFLRKRPRLSQDKKPAFFPLQGLADFTGQMRGHHGVTSDTYLSLFKLKGDLNVKMLLDS